MRRSHGVERLPLAGVFLLLATMISELLLLEKQTAPGDPEAAVKHSASAPHHRDIPLHSVISRNDVDTSHHNARNALVVER